MSDPNQPYGAVPPTSFPPPSGPPQGPPPGFPPPGGGPSGPPPGGPWGPPPPASGGKGKGLLVALGVIGALLLVGVVVALVVLLTNSDDDGDEKGDDDTTASTGAAPDKVVEGLIAAAGDADCDKAKTFLTETAQAADPCNAAEFRLLSTSDVDSEVGDPVIDGDEATVPVSFDNEGSTEDYVFNLEQVDGTWLVASYAIDSGGDDPTDNTSSTDDPTGDPTDTATTPGGTSTADAVANDPMSVVEAFMTAFVNGDCATAEDLVTEAYIKDEGSCDPSEITPFSSQLKYTVGKADVDEAAGKASVPVDITIAGEADRGTFTLVKVDGVWRINGSDDTAE
ncbi:hypothetical protein CFH99_21755 [Nocardioides aromaticivorans]|uniref:DUF4878 domain-containing protein n=1 Tax=Nocardioides aromaticivorans TaxID=200618 RepID=A0ABX7PRD3_9ACTN|nr:DUF4878 domain-containing protein [Nocardioides aromaticivorans]QSR28252.1 hypothetical protein CFH99_21755 [Nocardioides aromaticivorans]